MKIVIINGQNHKGSTNHIARLLTESINIREKSEITEYFLPRDMDEFCIGCLQCVTKSEQSCPHYEKMKIITESLDQADLMIFASPVYVYHVTGPMKSFLDHYAYRWLMHRPEKSMFKKQAVIISTAAGGGTKSTNKDLKDSMFYWGVAKIYSRGYNVRASSWSGVTPDKVVKYQKEMDELADKVVKKCGRVKPTIKGRIAFSFFKKINKKIDSKVDMDYWKANGWYYGEKPWNQ